MLQERQAIVEGANALAGHAMDILQGRHNELLSQRAASERAYRSQNAELRRSLEDLQSDSKSWDERMHNMAAHWRGQAKSWQVQSEPHIVSR